MMPLPIGMIIGAIASAVASLLFSIFLIVLAVWLIKWLWGKIAAKSIPTVCATPGSGVDIHAWLEQRKADFDAWVANVKANLQPVHDAARAAIDNALDSLDSTRATILDLMESAAGNEEVQRAMREALALLQKATAAIVMGAITATVASPGPDPVPNPTPPPPPQPPAPPAPQPAPVPTPPAPAKV